MRELKAIESDVSASFDLTIVQCIPASQLEAMEKTYSYMLDAVRDALKARRKADARAEGVHLRVAESKHEWELSCLRLRRIRRKGASFRALAGIAGSLCDAREMVKRGNALARARLADEKKALIIEHHRGGIGPCPSARIVAGRFGRCSAPYVVKIVKGYREALQPTLPMSTIRGIR